MSFKSHQLHNITFFGSRPSFKAVNSESFLSFFLSRAFIFHFFSTLFSPPVFVLLKKIFRFGPFDQRIMNGYKVHLFCFFSQIARQPNIGSIPISKCLKLPQNDPIRHVLYLCNVPCRVTRVIFNQGIVLVIDCQTARTFSVFRSTVQRLNLANHLQITLSATAPFPSTEPTFFGV